MLLDSSQRRTNFLREAVGRLGIDTRLRVVTARAEAAARDPGLRGRFDAVVARSFGPPAVTAECAVGLLRIGGNLVVSEPPGEEGPSGRWPEAGLAELGFGLPRPWRTPVGGFVRIACREQHDRWPRRVGIPAKRPRW